MNNMKYCFMSVSHFSKSLQQTIVTFSRNKEDVASLTTCIIYVSAFLNFRKALVFPERICS